MKKTLRRTLAVFLAIFMLSSLVCSASAEGAPKTATVEVPDFQGTLSVTVTVEDGTITDVAVIRSTEEATVGDQAVEQIPKAIVEANSVDVDAVSGATATSEAIKTAAKSALASLGEVDDSYLAAWAATHGYVLAEDYYIYPEIDGVTGASYKSEVLSQTDANKLSQEEVKELTLDYLRGYPMYFHIADGADIGADVIYVQSNIDLFEYLNATGGNYAYGDTYTGKSGKTYTYALPSYQIEHEDYMAGAQLGPDTTVTDEEFVAAMGEPEYSYREMYSVATSFNNIPGLAQSEAVLDPESMIIYLGSNVGSEKSVEVAANPNIKMYWINGINEKNYINGSDTTDNDYFHSYGVRIEGKAKAVDLTDVIDENGNILRQSVMRGLERYLISINGAREWFAAEQEDTETESATVVNSFVGTAWISVHVDDDMEDTASMLAETRYFADKWADMTDEEKTAAEAEVLSYMSKIYLGKIVEEADMYPADVAAIKEAGADVTAANLKSLVMDDFMNRSIEGQIIRTLGTGFLIEVVPEKFLTNTLWIIADCSTEDQVELYEAGDNPIMAKWARRFYELYTQRGEGQTGAQLRRQVYYPELDTSLDR